MFAAKRCLALMYYDAPELYTELRLRRWLHRRRVDAPPPPPQLRPDSRRLSGKAVGRNHTLIHWVVEEQLEPGNRVQTRVEAEADSTTSLLSILLPSSPFSG